MIPATQSVAFVPYYGADIGLPIINAHQGTIVLLLFWGCGSPLRLAGHDGDISRDSVMARVSPTLEPPPPPSHTHN